jgi:hypothetical protein
MSTIVYLKKSTKPDKKFMVLVDGKTIHFGAKGMSDYTIHKDKERMRRYENRHKSREVWGKSGMKSAGFWSKWILWNKPSFEASKRDTARRFGIVIRSGWPSRSRMGLRTSVRRGSRKSVRRGSRKSVRSSRKSVRGNIFPDRIKMEKSSRMLGLLNSLKMEKDSCEKIYQVLGKAEKALLWKDHAIGNKTRKGNLKDINKMIKQANKLEKKVVEIVLKVNPRCGKSVAKSARMGTCGKYHGAMGLRKSARSSRKPARKSSRKVRSRKGARSSRKA